MILFLVTCTCLYSAIVPLIIETPNLFIQGVQEKQRDPILKLILVFPGAF